MKFTQKDFLGWVRGIQKTLRNIEIRRVWGRYDTPFTDDDVFYVIVGSVRGRKKEEKRLDLLFHFSGRGHNKLGLEGLRLKVFDLATKEVVAITGPFKDYPCYTCRCEIKNPADRAFGIEFDEASFEEIFAEKLDA